MKRVRIQGKKRKSREKKPETEKNSQTLCISPSNRHKKGGHDSPPDTHNPAQSKVSKKKKKKRKTSTSIVKLREYVLP